MGRLFDPLYESVCLLTYGVTENRHRAMDDVPLILEDASSPTTRKYQEKLFKSVIEKGHVKFDGIEESQGNIANYSGYGAMMEVLDTIEQLAQEQRADNVKSYTTVIKKAIGYIRDLSATYQRGFQMRCEYVMMEYNLYTFVCIKATSALINEFVDYIKRPDKVVMTISLKNTNMRADLFYFQQLHKFNNVQESMGMDYRKMLEALINKGRNNFVGIDTIVGIGTISLVVSAIVPITRELVYQVYNIRKNVSQELELQAGFLEMNRVAVENNESLSPAERLKVLQKQEKLAQQLRRISSKLRVEAVTATKKAKQDLESDNKEMSMQRTKADVENSPITLF